MRIAIVTTHPPGQGSLNEYAYHFIRFLRQKPEVNEVILLADELPSGQQYKFSYFPSTEYNEIETWQRPMSHPSTPVKVVPCWRFGDWNNGWRILKAVRQTKPDVVLFNLQFATFGNDKISAALGLLTPQLVKKAGYATVVLLHNIMETVDLKKAGFSKNLITEFLIKIFGTVVTRSLLSTDLVALTIPKYIDILSKKYKADNLILAPHGSFDETVATPQFELSPGPLQIMTFGKFGTYKKIEILIEAFKLLTADQSRNLELVIAGSDSPNAPGYLETVKSQYANVPNIRFTGYVPEEKVSQIFSEAAVTVFPYTSTTGSSGVLHQAGDYAKAAVLPNLGDFAELIKEEGYTGEFFEPEDVNSLVQAIACIIDNPEHRCRLGMQNFLASRGIPISEVVDWYLLHFQVLLDKSPDTGVFAVEINNDTQTPVKKFQDVDTQFYTNVMNKMVTNADLSSKHVDKMRLA